MTATPAPATTVVRPSAARQRRAVLLSLIAVPLILLSLLINPNRQTGLIVFYVVVVAAAVVFTILRMRRMRVEYGDGRYRFVSMYRTREFTLADVRQVHTFTALRQGLYTFPDLMVEGQDGRRLMRLPGVLWDVSTLALLADEFGSRGVHLAVAQTPVTAADVRARFPRLVTWFEANQIVAAVLVGLGVAVISIIIVAIVVFALTMSPVI